MTMADNITVIKDPTVYIKPDDALVNFLKKNLNGSVQNKKKVPENIQKIITNKKNYLNKSDVEWLHQFLVSHRNTNDRDLLTGKELDRALDDIIEKKFSNFDTAEFLEEKNKNLPYLFDLMKGSELLLPKNEVVKRNPVLAERVERLKKEQEEKEYREMTQNVDTSKKHYAEDSLSYQMNMMNRHLIAVAQFLVSVGAGFAFGFLGIELMIGDINFGSKLLLGIACALVIAVAEFYFFAKHLNAEDTRDDARGKPHGPSAKGKFKTH